MRTALTWCCWMASAWGWACRQRCGPCGRGCLPVGRSQPRGKQRARKRHLSAPRLARTFGAGFTGASRRRLLSKAHPACAPSSSPAPSAPAGIPAAAQPLPRLPAHPAAARSAPCGRGGSGPRRAAGRGGRVVSRLCVRHGGGRRRAAAGGWALGHRALLRRAAPLAGWRCSRSPLQLPGAHHGAQRAARAACTAGACCGASCAGHVPLRLPCLGAAGPAPMPPVSCCPTVVACLPMRRSCASPSSWRGRQVLARRRSSPPWPRQWVSAQPRVVGGVHALALACFPAMCGREPGTAPHPGARPVPHRRT